MKPDATHIHTIKVVSNTHWDREFRRSFERTRHRLVAMMDRAVEVLESDPGFRSFTLDGHSILVKDYLEMRPEMEGRVRALLEAGRLLIGPYYTLPEEFSIGHEPLVRNLIWGRRTVSELGGKPTKVAYTPSSWGQTGQLPQILRDFGLDKMMFYRGISHHEADAEWIWEAPDGTWVYASRFALFARYNWYYLVHRPVTTGRVFEKDYQWGEFHEPAMRIADGRAGEDLSFDVLEPALQYHPERLEAAILDMVEREGRHFTTGVFLAMNGHDISAPHPLEPGVVEDAKRIFEGRIRIEQSDLDEFWEAALEEFDASAVSRLKGERRAYLKEGLWTYLFPGTISARTYLKQMDFEATARLTGYAEPMAALSAVLGAPDARRYLERAWAFLLDNHTHDANGGCAPDAVCRDMEYRYRKAVDLSDIASEEAMAHVVRNLDPAGAEASGMQLVVFNPLPFERDAMTFVDIELPRTMQAGALRLSAEADPDVPVQSISREKSSCFVDSIWEVPRILETHRLKGHARFTRLPASGYRVYQATAAPHEPRDPASLVSGRNTLENEFLRAVVNADGTLNVTNKETGRTYESLNHLVDQGECGNAWKHVPPTHDRVYSSLGVAADVAVVERGPLVSSVSATYQFRVPADYGRGDERSELMTALPVRVLYTLHAGERMVRVTMEIENRAKDHLLRAAFPTGLETDVSWADSHFDVVSRPIKVPDSTGWVERAFGTHPLRTFVELNDGKEGLAVLPQGLFEYEVTDEASRSILLTLVRACRIKLAVSEEKVTELPDEGIQCPGRQTFSYAIAVHSGTWRENALLNRAAEIAVPPRLVAASRGKGSLPPEVSVVALDNRRVHVTAVKPADEGKAVVIRLFNPEESVQQAVLQFGADIRAVSRVRMDEVSEPEELPVAGGRRVEFAVGAKKIVTLRVELGGVS